MGCSDGGGDSVSSGSGSGGVGGGGNSGRSAVVMATAVVLVLVLVVVVVLLVVVVQVPLRIPLLLLRVVEIVVIWGCLLADDLPVRMIACPRSRVVDQAVSVRVGRAVVLSLSLLLILFIEEGDGVFLFITRIFLLVQVAADVAFWLPSASIPWLSPRSL